MVKPFGGTTDLDVRDSVPDWAPYTAAKAPEAAPNVLVVLYDDIGLAAWEPFGGRIRMPTLQRLSDNGLRYAQWHTTALCSPTRSCLLTGRNHHENGNACGAERATGFPGSNGRIPVDNAFLAQVLRDSGYNTFWVGKNDNVAPDGWGTGRSKADWPLARGFDRFYGFIGGETDQWYPDLVEDNHYIGPPYSPGEGYHLSSDLADVAIRYLRDSRQSAPDRPWFLFYCPGAGHTPHHAPQDWTGRYRGAFDDGYDAYRRWALPRMVERGILPPGTQLTPRNPMPDGTFPPSDEVRPWNTLSDGERRRFARMAEVYAAYCEFTDHHVGRIVDFLAETGQLDNTLVVHAAGNGASAEGTPNGAVNRNRLSNRWPDDVDEHRAIDRLGLPDTYTHYPTGWAFAFSTPFRMFKRYSYQGGICGPLVVHWPDGFRARGEVRHQYHHAIDIVPTIVECCGIEFPEYVLGYQQQPLPGVSMRYSFDSAKAPTTKQTQYYAMLGTRAIWHEGWKAVAVHGPASGVGSFDLDEWQLFHTDVDRAEAHDLADRHPEKVQQLVNLWFREAGRYGVLPLDDRTSEELLAVEGPAATATAGTYVYYAGATTLAERDAPVLRGRSFRLRGQIEISDPDAQGVIVAQGSRFGGHSLFVKDGELVYVHNFIGVRPEQRFGGGRLTVGRHTVGLEFTKVAIGERSEAHGTARLSIDDHVVADGPMRTQPGPFSLSGGGMSIGRDTADAVSTEYDPPFPFRGGAIHRVEVVLDDDRNVPPERETAAMMARE